MKFQNILIITIIVFTSAYIVGTYLNRRSKDTITETASMITQTMEEPETSTQTEMMYPADAYVYEIKAGTVSYRANKTYFGKPKLEVVGTTTNVTGEGWFSQLENKMELNATVDLLGLASDSSKRDEDIQPLFKDKKVMVKMSEEFESKKIVMEESSTFDVTLDVTINGVTKAVPFTVETTVSDMTLNAKGSAPIMMSDFGIEAPSLIEVFSVADEIMIEFDVTGTRLNN